MDSELIALLEQEANAERERILTEARRRAQKIVEDAQAAADEQIASQRRRVDAEVEAARVRARGTSNLRAASVLLQAKDETIASVFAAAERELDRIASDRQTYERILGRLLAEAAEGVGGPVVECAEEDVAAVQETARQLGLDAEVRPSRDLRRGVRVRSVDGRFVVENTLRSRLERAKAVLVAQVAELLWG
ncbi:MAG: V-type ATP synthase subunit E [Armatimonadota bacterium]|nr:V-type ATP synthase subunit E [Armatimonadota bacterium]MDR5696240.1 V-type ATP synthase subunit E [Armatimonadota bacterium]